MPQYSTYNVLGASIEEDEISSGGVSAMRLVATETVSTATDQVDFTGLDIDATGHYILYYKIVNDEASNSSAINLCVNDDTTTTNYSSQALSAIGGTAGASSDNNARISQIDAGLENSGKVDICLTSDDYLFALERGSHNHPAATGLVFHLVQSDSTHSNITKINIVSDQSSGIGVGSVLELYKVVNT